jgi:hypothetical protein
MHFLQGTTLTSRSRFEQMRSIPALLVIFIAHASAFVSPSGLLNVRGPHSASIRRPGATQGICMFEWGRFAKTLTFFNGNPLLKARAQNAIDYLASNSA